jgi:hypothetical protein
MSVHELDCEKQNKIKTVFTFVFVALCWNSEGLFFVRGNFGGNSDYKIPDIGTTFFCDSGRPV